MRRWSSRKKWKTFNSFSITVLGCDKNTYDASLLREYLLRAGKEERPPDEAELNLVYTCCFIEEAKKETIDTLLDLSDFEGTLVAVGCFAVRYGKEVAREFREVDFWIEEHSPLKIYEFLIGSPPSERLYPSPSRHYHFVKVGDGCSRRCSFCVIPSIKGKFSFREEADVIAEIQKSVNGGAKEIVLVAQDTSQFLSPSFVEKVAEIEDLWKIRVFYYYPCSKAEKFLEAAIESPKFANYIHYPLQHVVPHLLERMRRSDTLEWLDVPEKFELTWRSDFIVGFPGETEEDFRRLLDFVENSGVEIVTGFQFSPEESTPAEKWNTISKKERMARLRELTLVGERKFEKIWKERIGEEYTGIVDEVGRSDVFVRTEHLSPEVDPQIVCDLPSFHVKEGDLVKVRINDALGHVIEGEILKKL